LNCYGGYQWHTFYGTNGSADSVDYGYGIAVDESDVYVTGFSYGPWNGSAGEFPKHAFTGTEDYNSEIFVLKLDQDGGYQWHTFYGSVITDGEGQSDEGMDLVLDSGNIYVAGISYGTWQGDGDISPLHPFSGSYNWNIMALALDKDGNYQWHTFYGTEDSPSEGFAIARDASSNLFVTGHSDGTWQGDGDTNPLHAYSGGSDIVVVKLNNSGGYQWHTFYGSEIDNEEGRGIAVGGNGDVYVTGNSPVTWLGNGSAGPIHPFAGNDDITVLKLNNSGGYQWHTFYGSSDANDYGCGIGVDGSSNVYVTGRSYASWQGDDSRDPLHAYAGGSDITVLKLNNSGGYQWHTFYGSSSGDDYGQAIAVKIVDTFYIAGYSSASWLRDGDAPPLHDYTGSNDIYVLHAIPTPAPTPTPTPTLTPAP
jgi:hypothetical protein